MTTHRKFDPTHDFEKVNQFLRDCYEPQNADGNWIQPIWDYSYYHGNTDLESLSNIGVWENQGQMVAVTVFGTDANDVCLCTLNSFQSLKPEMLEYAEQNLARPDAEGNGALNVFVHESNIELSEILRGAGYDRRECDRTFSHCDIPPSTAETILPDGFELKSLEEDNDIRKINKVMWRGFNHPGEPPDDHLPSRHRMQSSPNFRFDLTTVAVAPNGDYASFCGMWYDTDNRFGLRRARRNRSRLPPSRVGQSHSHGKHEEMPSARRRSRLRLERHPVLQINRIRPIVQTSLLDEIGIGEH